MNVLIVDAPEVLQRSLADAFGSRGDTCRMLPEQRTDVTTRGDASTQPRPGVPARLGQIAADAHGIDCVVVFAHDPAAEARTSATAAAALAGSNVSRLIIVTPLRGSRQPDATSTPAQRHAPAEHPIDVTVVAATPVYGPGDELVSRLLIMMRSLPIVPLLANGDRQYQPLWHEDLAHVLVEAAHGNEAVGPTCAVAGPQAVTQQELYDRIAPLIDKRPARVPVPDLLTRVGLKLIDAASGTDTASAEGRWAVDADAVVLSAADNDLERVLGRPATSLDEGLRRLVVELPEQLPGTGLGTLQVKHFWADLRGHHLAPREVIGLLRDRFADIMPVPVGIEPGAPTVRLDVGATITLHLPGRGHVQVRVEEADDAHVVLSTLRGHPLAGVVRFLAAPAAEGVRFEVMTADRAATPLDWLGLSIGGARLQDANWRTVVRRVADMAEATIDGVQSHVRDASDAEVEHLSMWVRRLVTGQREA